MPEGSHRFQVGSLNCAVLTDGYFSYPPEWFFPNADRIELARALSGRRLPTDAILSPYTCLLVQTGRHVILIDTGAGDTVRTAGALIARLDMEGVRARDIDTVVLTHAHSDHIGGSVDGAGHPAFPNARYVISEAEFDFWMGPRPDLSGMQTPPAVRASMAEIARSRLAALKLKLDLVQGESEVAPGVRLIPAAGHTPGHLAVMLSSGKDRLLNIADAALHPLHLERPEWEGGLDLACEKAAATRRNLLDFALSEHACLMAFHFPFPSIGKVETMDDGAGWNWSPGLALD